MDMGVYALTALTGLFGPALRVSAMAGTILTERIIGDGPLPGHVSEPKLTILCTCTSISGELFATARYLLVRVRPAATRLLEVYGDAGTLSG